MPPRRRTAPAAGAAPPPRARGGGAKKRRVKRPPPAPIPLPPAAPRARAPSPPEGPALAAPESVGRIAASLARANSWGERRQHLAPLLRALITYQQLSLLVHRLPPSEERVQAARMLKPRVRDSERSFFLFVQSFALLSERRTMSALFGIPLAA